MDDRPSGGRKAPVDRTRRTGRLVRRTPLSWADPGQVHWSSQRSSVGVRHLAQGDEDRVDQRPDAQTPEREELGDADAGVAQVQPVDAEYPEEEGHQYSHQPALVGEEPGDLPSGGASPPRLML